ncbi:hypothetical protein Nepgr_016790 [Nepenthes gracilis]|uniref:Uncharacterized protein n=1 Tax=Nepenthes gracilis TaxID=150966 RepID=A0AAD3SQB8_NEPGR|nr:hypothetical protein Nepgr_016790 [Nepenthes gracilis]
MKAGLSLNLFARYLDKKETAMEMEQQFQRTSSIDYSLKDVETLVLQLKNKAGCSMKSKYLEQGASILSPRERTSNEKEPSLSIKLPPPPPATLSTATTTGQSEHNRSSNSGVGENAKEERRALREDSSRYNHSDSVENQSSEDLPDDDFGDFQTAG